MSIFFGLLFARRFYCRSALSLSPGRTGGLFPRINAPKKHGRIEKPPVLIFVLKLFDSRCLANRFDADENNNHYKRKNGFGNAERCVVNNRINCAENVSAVCRKNL